MRYARQLTGWAIAVALLSACEKNPIEKLTNPLPGGAVPSSSGLFVIYDDELKTGGGLGFFPSGENQAITLADQSSPRRNVNCIRYTWNGQDVGSQHLFAGFSLLITPDFTTLLATPAKNLSSAAYTKVTLFVRGSLSNGTALRIEGPDDGVPAITDGHTPARYPGDITTLTNNWQPISFTVPPGDFTSVRSFITVSFQYTQPAGTTNAGEGGVVYLDDIHYEK